MYGATCAQGKYPLTASPKVKAGLIWLPDTLPNIKAGIITPIPYPTAMTNQPLWCPLVPFNSTLATAPFPKTMRIAVPKNSVAYLTTHSKSI